MVDFTSPCGVYFLTFEDDGKVAYAYLKKGKEILGDIWIYNRCPAPGRSEWKDRKNIPFANCKEYITDEGRIETQVAWDDIRVKWDYVGEQPRAYVYIFDELVAHVSVGEKPGYARYASKDGPCAKRMVSDEPDDNGVGRL
jgi:hypothetical protein